MIHAQGRLCISSAASVHRAFCLTLKDATIIFESCIEHLGSGELRCRELEAVLIDTSDRGARQGTAVRAQEWMLKLKPIYKKARVHMKRANALKLQENLTLISKDFQRDVQT